jgi:hypothetical protein
MDPTRKYNPNLKCGFPTGEDVENFNFTGGVMQLANQKRARQTHLDEFFQFIIYPEQVMSPGLRYARSLF